MRKLYPLAFLILIPGCTFYTMGPPPHALTKSELAEISPVIYLVIAMFCLILLVSITCGLFGKSERQQSFGIFVAIVTSGVVLMLLG